MVLLVMRALHCERRAAGRRSNFSPFPGIDAGAARTNSVQLAPSWIFGVRG
jgi:hypothetical protein